jgi:hypothetical protein
MSAVATDIVVIVFLLVLNGVFAMSEIAVITARGGLVLARLGRLPMPGSLSCGLAADPSWWTWTAAASTRCSSRVSANRAGLAARRTATDVVS